MIGSIYKKYVISLFGKTLVEVSSVFFALILIINLFEEITFLQNEDTNPFYPIFLSFLNTPSIIFDILPFIFLISTLFFFIKITEKNELFIFKYSGVTNRKILSILISFSFFLGIILIIVFYSFSSKLKSHYLEIKNSFTSDNKYLAVITENGFWIKDEIDEVISIINADSIDKNFLINVSIVQFNKNFEFIKSISSKKININSKSWIINNAVINKDNVTSKIDYLEFKSNFDKEKINNLFSNLSSMSLIRLNKLKKDYFSLGYSTIDIEVYEHKIYSLPIYLSIMTLLSGIIMFNSKQRNSKVFNILLGIFLSVIIYYVNYFSGLLGENGKIPIILSVWLPLTILIIISLIGMVRLNEK